MPFSLFLPLRGFQSLLSGEGLTTAQFKIVPEQLYQQQVRGVTGSEQMGFTSLSQGGISLTAGKLPVNSLPVVFNILRSQGHECVSQGHSSVIP